MARDDPEIRARRDRSKEIPIVLGDATAATKRIRYQRENNREIQIVTFSALSCKRSANLRGRQPEPEILQVVFEST
jgi:hypothetical protein